MADKNTNQTKSWQGGSAARHPSDTMGDKPSHSPSEGGIDDQKHNPADLRTADGSAQDEKKG